MVGKFIHGNLQGRGGKACHMVAHGPQEAVYIAIEISPVIVAVLLHTGQKPGDRFHKGVIIHNGIPFFASQPVFGISVVLRQNDCIGVGLFYGPTEGFPEKVIVFRTVSQIGRYIQPPAVSIVRLGYPFGGNFHDILK